MKKFHLKIKRIIICLICFLAINNLNAQDLRYEKYYNEFIKTYEGFDEVFFFKNAPIIFIGVPKETKYFYNVDSTMKFQSTLIEVSNIFKGQALIQKGTIERIEEIKLSEGSDIPRVIHDKELSRKFIFDESPVEKYIYFCDINIFSPLFTNNLNNKTLKYFEFAHNYKLYLRTSRYTSFPGSDTTLIYNPMNQNRYKSLDELVNYINANGVSIPNVYEQGVSLESTLPNNSTNKETYDAVIKKEMDAYQKKTSIKKV